MCANWNNLPEEPLRIICNFMDVTWEALQLRGVSRQWRDMMDSVLAKRHELSMEQYRYLLIMLNGESIFLTGRAGTGKTRLLHTFLKLIKYKDTAATATTGIAASHMKGQTLHSFFHIFNDGMPSYKLLRTLRKEVRFSICGLKRLVIDEVSMLSKELFEKLDFICKQVRRNMIINGKKGSELVMGGIQLICVGDFYQLPPVEGSFVFLSHKWKKLRLCELKQVWRQSETDLVSLLEDVRNGKTGKQSLVTLKHLQRELTIENDVLPTRLYPFRKSVENINKIELEKLQGQSFTYRAINTGKSKPNIGEDILILKDGAQVVVNANLSKLGLVNGDRAVTTRCCANTIFIKTLDGKSYALDRHAFSIYDGKSKIVGTKKQFPLTLAYALTIHKSQGMSLDFVEMDLGRCFASGQAYVALSRARSLQGLRVIQFNESSVMVNPVVVDYMEGKELQQGEKRKNPILKPTNPIIKRLKTQNK